MDEKKTNNFIKNVDKKNSIDLFIELSNKNVNTIKNNFNLAKYDYIKYSCFENYYLQISKVKHIQVLVTFLMYSNDLEIINIFFYILKKLYNNDEEIDIINIIFDSYIYNILLYLEGKNSEMVNILYSDYKKINNNHIFDNVIIFLSLNVKLNKINDLVKLCTIYFNKLKLFGKNNILTKNKLYYIINLLKKYNINIPIEINSNERFSETNMLNKILKISDFFQKHLEELNKNENFEKIKMKHFFNEIHMMSKLLKKNNIDVLYNKLIKKYSNFPEKIIEIKNRYYNANIRILTNKYKSSIESNINNPNSIKLIENKYKKNLTEILFKKELDNLTKINNIEILQEKCSSLINEYKNNPNYMNIIEIAYIKKMKKIEFKNNLNNLKKINKNKLSKKYLFLMEKYEDNPEYINIIKDIYYQKIKNIKNSSLILHDNNNNEFERERKYQNLIYESKTGNMSI